MNTPQMMTRFSAWLVGMTPATTLSATARPTAAWAGPNICTACFRPLMVTLVISTVAGLQGQFGAMSASRVLWPGGRGGGGAGKAIAARAALLPEGRGDLRA